MRKKEKKMVLCIVSLGFLLVFFCAICNQTKQKWEFTGYQQVTILPGDTVWDIAEEFKAQERKTMDYAKEIMRLNKMSSDVLKEGEKILIPLYR